MKFAGAFAGYWNKFGAAYLLCAAFLIPTSGFAQGTGPVNLSFGPETNKVGKDTEAALNKAKNKRVRDLRVRFVKVEGRWTNNLPLPLKAGDTLTSEKLSAAMAALRDAITSSSNQIIGLQTKGEVGVLYIEVEYDKTTADGTVGVTFRPYYIDIALVQIGNNVLPIPRSAFATIYKNVPEPLRALNPTLGFSYDHGFGSAASASIGGDLMPLFTNDKNASADRELDLRADSTKSLDESFYRANATLGLTLRHQNSLIQELTFSGAFNGEDEPLGVDEHTRNAGVANLDLKLKVAPNTHLFIDAGYRGTSDTVSHENSSLETNTSADEQTVRLLLDAIPPSINGFLRAALWEEGGWQTSGDSYQRVVGRVGYEKEITISPNQTIGVEIVGGGGTESDDTPLYARFFGGTAPGQFLYDGATATTLMNMPSGPIIRSFGDNEAMLRDAHGRPIGGDSFWHVNLNVSIPIPILSRPLIPNELTDLPDSNGNPLSVKQVLRNQIDRTGPNMLAAVLQQQQGLSQTDATRRANQILREVKPATDFVIDDANLYSVKPLMMVDAAGLSAHDGSSATWCAVGGGIQITVVTAKVEAGYMRTVSGPTFDHKGNAFVRLVFQNLF